MAGGVRHEASAPSPALSPEAMEKGKPFKLFVPPRLSSGQVSAVKPQSSARAAGLCQVNGAALGAAGGRGAGGAALPGSSQPSAQPPCA